MTNDSRAKEAALTPQVEAVVSASPREDLWGGKSCDVPEPVAVCPECGHKLHVYCWSWIEETGQPHGDDLQIDCHNIAMYDDEEDRHKYRQSDWQAVVDAVRTWAEAASHHKRGGNSQPAADVMTCRHSAAECPEVQF